jgi:hypothetical protein
VNEIEWERQVADQLRARVLELEQSLRASEAEAEALAAEQQRLREGLVEALRQLEEDRYIIARNVLRGVISGETW